MIHQISFPNAQRESGNVLVVILLAIVLIGALSVAIQGSSQRNATIDQEKIILSITEVQRYMAELERAVNYIMQNGHSESDIRFAHPDAHTDYGDLSSDTDKSDQVFDRDGGAALYRGAPEDVNDGSSWEFYGNTALPLVGSDRPELIAVLPNISETFCRNINNAIGYDASGIPEDTGTCLSGVAGERFDNGTQFSSSPNTVNTVTFTIQPSVQGCAICDDKNMHFFYVLMAR